MSNRSLLILALLALSFCSYLYFKGGEPGTREKEEEAVRLFILDHSKVQRIELTNPSGTYVFQKKGENDWVMEKPIKFPVDPSAIGSLLSELEFNQKKRVIQKSEVGDYQVALQKFGLKDSRITARFQTDKEAVDLQVGSQTPSGNLFYAVVRDPKKQELAVVDDAIESLLMQNLDIWRNPEVFDLKNDEAVGLLLRRGNQEVEVSRQEEKWAITKPLKEEAEKKKIEAFLAELASLRATSFISETGSDPAQYGLNTPSFTLDVLLAHSRQSLRVGKAKADQPNLIYAQFGDRPAIFTLHKKNAERLGDLLDAIRPRHLFKLDANTEVRTVQITQGANTVTLQRQSGDSWIAQGDGIERKANALGANDIIQAMQVIEGGTFYSSVDNPNAEYGLQKPSALVKISGYDAREVGKAFAREVVFGATKDNLVYVQSSVLPFVVDADRRFLDALPKGVFGWFDRSLGLAADGEITGLTWSLGTSQLVLVKGVDGKWISVPAGKNVDETYLKTQLGFLSELKVLRWVGKAAKKDFAKPRFVLEIKAGEKSRQLIFGPKQSDGKTLAKMGDDDYAFMLTNEDAQKVMVRPISGDPFPTP